MIFTSKISEKRLRFYDFLNLSSEGLFAVNSCRTWNFSPLVWKAKDVCRDWMIKWKFKKLVRTIFFYYIVIVSGTVNLLNLSTISQLLVEFTQI